MRDEYDSRFWVEHGKQFSADLGRFLDSIGRAFTRLNAIQFRAPWRRDHRSGSTC
jgi:hypothetical protein